ncbi:hypothetical protein HNQ07_004285 [Deinococcus metalli]|uniref:Uncharacterized protein n=1 Tax=Deinococcus metalli TaxID=1141878 RepID=A0A7W8KJ82_9DEIO|nr:hypothetical protein [Deinococcus metalli]MBB5378778.1 hypothetical protein [Deinococcus metalli]GHF60794.1 hypothetical protein GCM10017781_41320 [Deinococcus metalli]
MSNGLGRGKEVRSSPPRAAQVQRIQMRAARRGGGPTTRVVIKANYVRVGGPRGPSAAGTGKAFASANYMMFRPGEDGAHRQAFNGKEVMDPDDVHKFVGESCKHFPYAYRVVMSPDHNFGNETTQEWAARTLTAAGYTHFFVVAHAGEKGHTEHPHAHAMVFTDGKLTRDDFKDLREFGDVQAKVMEMRFDHDRHMKEELWKAQRQEAFTKWLEAKREVSSQGVEDGGGSRKEDREKENTKKQQASFGMEM